MLKVPSPAERLREAAYAVVMAREAFKAASQDARYHAPNGEWYVAPDHFSTMLRKELNARTELEKARDVLRGLAAGNTVVIKIGGQRREVTA